MSKDDDFVVIDMRHINDGYFSFWGPGHCGYVTDIAFAGRYSRRDILRYPVVFQDDTRFILPVSSVLERLGERIPATFYHRRALRSLAS